MLLKLPCRNCKQSHCCVVCAGASHRSGHTGCQPRWSAVVDDDHTQESMQTTAPSTCHVADGGLRQLGSLGQAQGRGPHALETKPRGGTAGSSAGCTQPALQANIKPRLVGMILLPLPPLLLLLLPLQLPSPLRCCCCRPDTSPLLPPSKSPSPDWLKPVPCVRKPSVEPTPPKSSAPAP